MSREFTTPNSNKPRTVYFIRPVGMKGPIKIGCSGSPEGRKSSLETWSPFALEVIAEVPGSRTLEAQFHALFLDYHERREWFRWAPLFDEVIEQLNAGTFDLAGLPPPRGVSSLRKGNKRPRSPEFCRQLSISLRCQNTASRTGYHPPINPYGIVARGDEAGIAGLEAYFANPPSGVAKDYPWAVQRRAAYHAKHPERKAA